MQFEAPTEAVAAARRAARTELARCELRGRIDPNTGSRASHQMQAQLLEAFLSHTEERSP